MFRPQITVEIVYKNRDSIKKKCSINGSKVVIKKGKRGRGGLEWSPRFEEESILAEQHKIFGLFTKEKKRLMVMDGAEKCVNFKSEGDPDLNGLDRTDLENLSNLEVIRRSGDVTIKHELPLVFWLLFALGIANVILTVFRDRFTFV